MRALPRTRPTEKTATSNEGGYVSRLTRDTLALILAGGQGYRLHELATWRAPLDDRFPAAGSSAR